jgi:hypothetical protein
MPFEMDSTSATGRPQAARAARVTASTPGSANRSSRTMYRGGATGGIRFSDVCHSVACSIPGCRNRNPLPRTNSD